MTDFIVSIILALIFGGAIYYIVKSKKSGKRCIGCPDASACGKKNCECGDPAITVKKFKVEREKSVFDQFDRENHSAKK